MKKIVFIANNNMPSRGLSGGDRIFTEFTKGWQKQLEITLCGSTEAIHLAKKNGVAGIKFICTSSTTRKIKYRSIQKITKIGYMFKHILINSFRGLLSIFSNRKIFLKYDYVYSVSDFYPDLIPALFLKLYQPKIKWIAGYYLFAPNPFAKNSPYKGKARIKGFLYYLMQIPSYHLVRQIADYVFVTSEPDVKKFITQRRNKNKIIVVQGGVNIKPSEEYLKSDKVIPVKLRKYDACFIGRFHYQKGVLELIDIWQKVVKVKPNAFLAMIGNGESELRVREKIKKYKLKTNIDLLGFLDGEKKYSIFKQSKIILHPATFDSGGMAAAEAMAWGLPGVSFDLESLKTYYPSGMIKTKCYNLQEFAENIFSLLDDEKYYQKISKEAHEMIIRIWNWKTRTNLIYQKVFNNKI